MADLAKPAWVGAEDSDDMYIGEAIGKILAACPSNTSTCQNAG